VNLRQRGGGRVGRGGVKCIDKSMKLVALLRSKTVYGRIKRKFLIY